MFEVAEVKVVLPGFDQTDRQNRKEVISCVSASGLNIIKYLGEYYE